MSKHLVKIICICAIALLVPLVIVGVALSVTEPVLCTLTLEQTGKNGQYVGAPELSIRVEGKDVDGTTVKVKKHSEITVVFSGEGYKFEGWYECKADEITAESNPVKGEDYESYTFLLRGDTTLTALRNVIEYNVTYTGNLANGNDVSTVVDPVTQTIEYGADLADLADGENGEVFEGWVVSTGENSANAQVYTKAMFANTEVNLLPKYSNTMLITYKSLANDTVIAVDTTTQEEASSYVLLDESNDAVKNALQAGYEFVGWMDASQQDVAAIEYSVSGVTLYLKEAPITYTLNVKYNAVSDENPSTITYDAKNGFSAYALKESRAGYTFKGFEFGGVTYLESEGDYVSGTDKLSDKIKAGQVSGTITAVWECLITSVNFNFAAYSEYVLEEGDDAGMWSVYATKNEVDDVVIKDEDVPVYFLDSENELCYDLTESIYELAFNAYTNLHIYEYVGGVLTPSNVEFTGYIYVSVDDVQVGTSYFESENITFLSIISDILSARGNLEGISEISLSFMFEKAA